MMNKVWFGLLSLLIANIGGVGIFKFIIPIQAKQYKNSK